MKKDTYFVDIDGTLIKYRKFETYETTKAEPVTPVVNFLKNVEAQGNMIILTTARPESYRELTISELESLDIPYHKLIMGIERGIRYLINDVDPNQNQKRAIAMNLERDTGRVI